MEIFDGHLDKSTKDTYTASTSQVKNDNTMSALKLKPGCCVTLFDEPNFNGEYKKTCKTLTFEQLKKEFGDQWNDRVSSLKLESGDTSFFNFSLKP